MLNQAAGEVPHGLKDPCEDRFRLRVSTDACALASSLRKKAFKQSTNVPGKSRIEGLAAWGRWAGKKLGLTATNHHQRGQHGSLRSDLNQNDERRDHCNRSRSLQLDAQRAMVGVGAGVQGVGMSDLRNQQKRHQSQTHQRR